MLFFKEMVKWGEKGQYWTALVVIHFICLFFFFQNNWQKLFLVHFLLLLSMTVYWLKFSLWLSHWLGPWLGLLIFSFFFLMDGFEFFALIVWQAQVLLAFLMCHCHQILINICISAFPFPCSYWLLFGCKSFLDS